MLADRSRRSVAVEESMVSRSVSVRVLALDGRAVGFADADVAAADDEEEEGACWERGLLVVLMAR